MGPVASLLRKGSLNATGMVAGGALGLLTRVVLARNLGPSGFGLLSEAFAVLTFFSIVAMLGYHDSLPRPGGGRFYPAFFSSFSLSMFLTALLLVAVSVFSLPAVFKVFALSLPGLVGLRVVVAGYRAENDVRKKVVFGDLVYSATVLLAAFGTFLFPEPVTGAAAYTIGAWMAFVPALASYFRNYPARKTLDGLHQLLRSSAPLALADIFSYGIGWVNVVLLGWLVGPGSAGLYVAAMTLALVFQFARVSLRYSYLPMASGNKKEGMAEITRELSGILALGAIPVFLAMVFQSRVLLSLVFGPGYARAATALVLMSLTGIIHLFLGFSGELLLAERSTIYETFARFTGFSVLIAVAAALPYGLETAALAYFSGTLAMDIVRLQLTGWPRIMDVDARAVAAAVLPAPVLLMPFTGLLLYPFLYLSAAYLLKPLAPSDLEAIEEMGGETFLQLAERFSRR
ncbi:MAG: oligosaccharide flippase family protein [Candidatus Nanohaloarchaea archaeon]